MFYLLIYLLTYLLTGLSGHWRVFVSRSFSLYFWLRVLD